MMTVKEIAKLTGVSARTLHYYDEIGLFTPTEKSDAGYRMYDEHSLEILQQILFFREFDIPLKQIKTVMSNPAFDRNSILRMQRKMLVEKKERMERLISSIDEILGGDQQMKFEVFNKNELEDMYRAMLENISEEQKKIFIERYGSVEAWKEAFLASASSEQAQKNFEQVVEWYGGKEPALEAAANPMDENRQIDYQKRMEALCRSFAAKKDINVDEPEIQTLAAEYDALTKEMFQLPDAKAMVLEIANAYCGDATIQAAQDSVYGAGSTEYMGRAWLAFYINDGE